MNEHVKWRKSSRSGTSGGACVAVAVTGEAALVKDTKLSDSPILRMSKSDFAALRSLAQN